MLGGGGGGGGGRREWDSTAAKQYTVRCPIRYPALSGLHNSL